MRWLQWALDNLWTLLIIAGVVAQLLQAMRRKGQDAETPGTDAAPKEYEFEDPELAERTRRIRAEIQRKISERQRGGAPAPAESAWEQEAPSAPAMPPVAREIVSERAPTPPPVMPGYGTRFDAQRSAEILEQQAALAERLQQAEEMKAAARRRAIYEAKTVSGEGQARKAARAELLEELRTPEALRRAFILREVLGPPVGLR